MKYMKNIVCFFILSLSISSGISAQNYVSKVWVADQGNGTYINPIINADYSDPDVCAVGNDFYLTASSFNCIPGLPILHSNDLVNWKIVNYALKKQIPTEIYDKPQHGKGVWAPCIRYHKGEFYIYWGDPDFGIYMIKTSNPEDEWSEPVLVKAGKGMIDPSPLWDEDGKVYLINAWAGSRCGINSVLVVSEMNSEGTKVISDPVMVFDGNDGVNHTVEGPKFYKRNGYYYIMAPAGGVEQGWQLAMRSKNIYGPYESKIVMAQGKSAINGPHQGAWVETNAGESWFINFQDKAVYGRVLHLNPMKWINDWPVIGVDKDGDGCGEPVTVYKKPTVGKVYPKETPVESDEFSSAKLGLQWEWHANYKDVYGFPSNSGFMRLYAGYLSEKFVNFWEVPNLLMQKFPAEEFVAKTKLAFTAKQDGEKAGLIVMGWDYSYISICKRDNLFVLQQAICKDAEKQTPEQVKDLASFPIDKIISVGAPNYIKYIYLKVTVSKGGKCTFAYSLDDRKYISVGDEFIARQGKWIGAKIGLFCVNPNQSGNKGWVDVDWFRIDR